MSQSYRKTILIVCEGVRSEPDYFHYIRNEVITNCGNEIFIKIIPTPVQEKIQEDVDNFKLRDGAKKRQIIETNKVVEDFVIEEEYRAQPVCYVRKAQLAYLESNYDELWAIYDKDGHPRHKEALDLADSTILCPKKVNIGFSSISFEFWLLMHFEYSEAAFTKSQCRNAVRETFACGTNIHEQDCKGVNCVVGKIVQSGYMQYGENKFFEYSGYQDNYPIAAENAIKIREKMESDKPVYDLNPYLTIDKLVFKLKYLHISDHFWTEETNFEIEKNIICSLEKEGENLKCLVTNNSAIAFIWNASSLILVDTEYAVLFRNDKKIIQPNETVSCLINLAEFAFSFLIINIGSNKANIFDRSFVRSL